jgi:hypothetical protein
MSKSTNSVSTPANRSCSDTQLRLTLNTISGRDEPSSPYIGAVVFAKNVSHVSCVLGDGPSAIVTQNGLRLARAGRDPIRVPISPIRELDPNTVAVGQVFVRNPLCSSLYSIQVAGSPGTQTITADQPNCVRSGAPVMTVTQYQVTQTNGRLRPH